MKIPFIELDREIEKEAGIDLSEIFSLYGQSGYRRIEQRMLDRMLSEYSRAVLSIGGGVVSEKETYDRLLSSCFTVWVRANPEEYMARVIAQGDFRVVAENNEAMEDLRRILEAREPFYRRADISLDTSGESVEESFMKLKRELKSEIVGGTCGRSIAQDSQTKTAPVDYQTEPSKYKHWRVAYDGPGGDADDGCE